MEHVTCANPKLDSRITGSVNHFFLNRETSRDTSTHILRYVQAVHETTTYVKTYKNLKNTEKET